MNSVSCFAAVCAACFSTCSPAFNDDTSLYAETLPADATRVPVFPF